jgi:hypothetical protein
VINDTVEPEATPRILKALPVHPQPAMKAKAAQKAVEMGHPHPARREDAPASTDEKKG